MALYQDDPELADLHQRWLAGQTRRDEVRAAELTQMKADRDGTIPHEVMMELAARAQDALDAIDEWKRLDAEYTAARDRYHDTRRRQD